MNLVCLVCIALPILVLIVRWWLRIEANRSMRKKVSSLTAQHVDALAARRRQLVRRDAYGNWMMKAWDKELDYFIDTVLQPALYSMERFQLVQDKVGVITDIIEPRIVAAQSARNIYDLEFDPSMSGDEFETFCTEILARLGWNANRTPKGPDFGADIFADRNGVKVVLQCKKSSSTVGVKAIQEVTAAKAHFSTPYACVVSNAPYTRQADDLAHTNGVLLLHFSALSELDGLVMTGDAARGPRAPTE